jgi:nucleotide-binding universal stress UspA family protein
MRWPIPPKMSLAAGLPAGLQPHKEYDHEPPPRPQPAEAAMNALRRILVHVDASPRVTARLKVARELAATHGAELTLLYAVTPLIYEQPFAMAEGASGAWALIEQADVQRQESARRRVIEVCGSAGPAYQFDTVEREPVVEGFARRALCADLMVLGQYDSTDPQAGGVPADFVESVILQSGRPAIVVPYAGPVAAVGRDVLLAWKPTREAARAVSSAMPLLQRARNLHVVGPAVPGEGVQGSPDLAAWLRAHGVAAALQQHHAAPDETGEGLLSLAADLSVDMIVMGVYGHSRVRELVLGGASRTMLQSMTVPVWMDH